MRRQKFLMGGFALLAVLCLSACGAGIRQSSAASDDDTAHIHPAGSAADKPTVYTTQAGDTLAQIAGRPEVFGDPELWPLLKDANAESLSATAADAGLTADLALEIPRNSTPEAMDAARMQARHFEALQKIEAAEKMEAAAAAAATPVPTEAAEPTPEDVSTPEPTPEDTVVPVKEAATAVVPSPVPTMASAPPPAPPAAPSKMLPLFVLLALVLAALGAVFYVFFRRDKQDFE